MPPSRFLSRTSSCLFIAAPTAWVSMHRVALLRAPPSLSLPASGDAPVKKGQEQQQELRQLQGSTDGAELEGLSLRIQDQLAKIGERFAHTDSTVQQHINTLSLMQRQQAVLERRVAGLEDEAARMQQQIVETTRLASDVVLQHRNVEALVRQMEKLVLKHALSPSPSPSPSSSSSFSSTKPTVMMGHSSGGEVPSSSNAEIEGAHVSESLEKAMPNSLGAATCSSVAAPAGIARQVAALNTRMEALQARLDQLTVEKLVMDRVQTHTQQHQQMERVAEVAVARVAAAAAAAAAPATTISKTDGSAGEDTPLPSSKALARVLRNSGAFPFKDNAGVTRISSQRVFVRGIPPNLGAGEVRDLFSRVGSVVSCVVRRTPVAAAEGGEIPKSSRYRSQQQEQEQTEKEKGGNSETSHRSASATTTNTAAAAAEDDMQERAFEVTFRAAEHAVRAVLELHGYQLEGKCTISVEPLLSADVIAALRQLERESNVP